MISSSFLVFQQEIAAVAAESDGPGAAPYLLGMQIAISRVVAIAKASRDLRTAIALAGLEVRASHDVEPRFIAMGFGERIDKARIRAKAVQRDLHGQSDLEDLRQTIAAFRYPPEKTCRQNRSPD